MNGFDNILCEHELNCELKSTKLEKILKFHSRELHQVKDNFVHFLCFKSIGLMIIYLMHKANIERNFI